ncbi:M14 family metallopeptidase [Pontibacter sp. G13]|uniref:M14 family metallopeptidase n=1 Tax=Pontibacter sp. G13 TaxID=3074898 RepID=UPI00288AD34F|nr:M14 family metallopeptidase [Pontibacter sp. G13]WNJ21293.1 M14 family metallopeptidase [Pontibacter sp. G13]
MKLSTGIALLGLVLDMSLNSEWTTPYEASDKMASATYEEAIDYYQRLSEAYPEISLLEGGKTDVGRPLHLVVIDGDGFNDPQEVAEAGKVVLFINNGIHPGEPCGIDASMMLARDLVQEKAFNDLLKHVTVVLVPIYNVGGSLNRGCCSRANQVGPEAYGFRGNARNLDLNRDFIKADSKNAKAFTAFFQAWKPHLFIDTHTTNGADYQATMTYLPSHPDKLGPQTGPYMQNELIPAMEKWMSKTPYILSPYVNSVGSTPDDGIAAFLDAPRYSSGYAALSYSMGFTTEAHMLKSFEDRVSATYSFLEGMIRHAHKNASDLRNAVEADRQAAASQKLFAVDWELDQTDSVMIDFKGFEAKYKPSEVTGQPRLYYDRSAPYTKPIPYYHRFAAKAEVETPDAYLIPQVYSEVIERLEMNGVELKQIAVDTVLDVEVYRIEDVNTLNFPWEGHYFHRNVVVSKDFVSLPFYAGDYVAFTNQTTNPYLVHTLEPFSTDAFFRWNFFDAILMRKEYFSPYVFEDEAAAMLSENVELKQAFEALKAQDSVFAAQPRMQLNYLYEHSEHYEQSYNRYPVVRWTGENPLPLK